MSLDFDVSDVTDHETRCWVTDERGRQRPNPGTEALVFHTMTIGISAITETNVDEVTRRVTETETLLGPFLHRLEPGQEPAPRPITPDEIRAHIGLRTNAAHLSRTAWRRGIEKRRVATQTR